MGNFDTYRTKTHTAINTLSLFQKQLVINLLGLTDSTIFYENLKHRLCERICTTPECIESLGLLEDTPVVKLNTPLDTLSHYLSKKLSFGKYYRLPQIIAGRSTN